METLKFPATQDGAPPQVLLTGGRVLRPAGGPPMRVLTSREDVLKAQTDPRFQMAHVSQGQLTGEPLTGAEMQSPNGGLLSMNPPELGDFRRPMAKLFTPEAASATYSLAYNAAVRQAVTLRKGDTFDAMAQFVVPVCAEITCTWLGVPVHDFPIVDRFSKMAFGPVQCPEAVSQVARAWSELYEYYAQFRESGIIAAIRAASSVGRRAWDQVQQVHVIGTVANGLGAFLPVLAVSVAALLDSPPHARYISANKLLAHRAIFPVTLPRVAMTDVPMDAGLIHAGEHVLPSLIAATRGGTFNPWIGFGQGPHWCLGKWLAREWLSACLEVFFGTFPEIVLDDRPLKYTAGTLQVPQEIWVKT